MERNPIFPENMDRERNTNFSNHENQDIKSSSYYDRKTVRNVHKRLRSEMSKEDVTAKSALICEKLLQAKWYDACSVIYGYYPLGNEVNCLPFLLQALEDGKRVALPRTESLTTSMEFYEISSLEEVEEGKFYVMEPITECPKIHPQNAIFSVMLVPGVVFDVQGNRYGYGKGYYDRYLARFSDYLKTMALAYENQIEQRLDVLDTDIPMEYIYTERRIYPME